MMKFFRLFLLGLLSLGLAACAEGPRHQADHLLLERTTFDDLHAWSWGADHRTEALPALRASCHIILRKPEKESLGLQQAGSPKDWVLPCHELEQADSTDEGALRRLFETYFVPYAVKNEEAGLFTGYYEASLRGSLEKNARFQTPIWEKPADLVSQKQDQIHDSVTGQDLKGKMEGDLFVPYDTRADIEKGSLENRAKPLVWVDDPIEAFFLEIQGSGRIELDDGSSFRLAYAAQNGRPYTAIGKVLLDEDEITRPVTREKIKEWLQAHPDRAQDIMNRNESFVFFRKLDEGDGPIGAQGVFLTPRRSLAVDPHFVPLGVPLWLTTGKRTQLVVAQDVGGAIKGPVRGDLFWGIGSDAEEEAGVMQERGTYALLLPKKTAEP